jgi:ribosomal protein L7/L12
MDLHGNRNFVALAAKDTFRKDNDAQPSIYMNADVERLIGAVTVLADARMGKIATIKIIRDVAIAFGVEMGLKDAKDLVDYVYETRGLH